MTLTDHPRAYAHVAGDAAIFTAPDGHRETVPDSGGDIRAAVLRRATDEARRAGAPVELVTRGDRGEHHLLVDSDGTLTPIGTGPAFLEAPDSATTEDRDSVSSGVPDFASSEIPDSATAQEPKSEAVKATLPITWPSRRRTATAPSTPGPEVTALETPGGRVSFITDDAPVTSVRGWRGALARLGIRVSPSSYEVARDQWVGTVSRQWAGCRTVAVVNGKGGVGKTMTTAMLAAAYARNGGGNVLAWDNNDTRGTLGWRTETGLYDTTLRDLLPAAHDLLGPDAGVADISRFVHHQATDRYDVLRSNPELLATDQRLDETQFDLLMRVAAHYYRLVVFDSGNDESADRWIRMIDSTRQLVIPTLSSPESAESAALLLEALRQRDDASAALADSAVVVVTQAEPGDTSRVRQIADGFEGTVRAVHTVPFDPALKSGSLRFDQLRRATQDAWLRVAAAASDAL